eukprot:4052698-Amphidinium_carterae.1
MEDQQLGELCGFQRVAWNELITHAKGLSVLHAEWIDKIDRLARQYNWGLGRKLSFGIASVVNRQFGITDDLSSDAVHRRTCAQRAYQAALNDPQKTSDEVAAAWQAVVTSSNSCRQTLRDAKTQCWSEFCSTMNWRDSSAPFRALRTMDGKGSSPSVGGLRTTAGRMCCGAYDKACTLN